MKRGRPKLYIYTDEQIIEDYLLGLSAKESAERLGIPTFIVFSARSNLKLPSLHQYRKKSANRIDVPETLIKEYKNGSPINLLVEKYKIGKDVITRELKLRGIQIRRGRQHKHLDNNLIVEMYKKKFPLQDIAVKLNVSVRTIVDRLADEGIDVSYHPKARKNPVFGHEHYISGLPDAKKKVSGLQVLNDVPNTESIPATMNKFLVIPEIKELPINDFQSLPEKIFYSKSSIKKAHKLATDIAVSGKIKPLIVVIDTEGPYILEGIHRLAALHILGKNLSPHSSSLIKTIQLI